MTVKERPILFSTPMVQAILDGHKTMSRQVINKLIGYGQVTEFRGSDRPGRYWHFYDKQMFTNDIGERAVLTCCPYGVPGDRLWVKETWAAFDSQAIKDRDRSKVFYRADNQTNYSTDGKWKSPRFMPRWANRILLEVTDVKIERLQDISEADAKAEGADALICDNLDAKSFQFCKDMGMPSIEKGTPYKNGFALLWDSISGPGAWDANPWVWVIRFRRIEP